MKLVKLVEVNVDLEKEIKRINSSYNRKKIYNKEEREFLHTIVNLFESCKFDECLIILAKNKNKEWNEYLGIEISDVLWDIHNYGTEYTEVG